MHIAHVSNEQALYFLKRHKANKEQISITSCELWYAMVEDNPSITPIITGVLGIVFMRSSIRIKCLFVSPIDRKRGIATQLLEKALEGRKDKVFSAYATVRSKPLFEKYGFEVKSTRTSNNVSYMVKVKEE